MNNPKKPYGSKNKRSNHSARERTQLDWRATLEQGLQVIAVKRKSKKPAFKAWNKRPFKDEKAAAAYFEDHPSSNFGILTGAASGVVVLDVDGPIGRRSLAELIEKHGKLPKTPRVLTGRGEHRYFLPPGGSVPNSVKKIGPGIDLRGDDGYVVGAGSVHPDGARYRYKRGRALGDVPIAAMPDWLAKMVTKPQVAKANCRKSVVNVVKEGQRNNFLASLAGTLRRNGLAAETILAALNAENATSCMPPLDDDEVEKIADSIAGYSAGPIGSDGTDAALSIMQKVLDEEFAGGAHLLCQSGRFWAWDNGIWTIAPEGWLRRKALDVVESQPVKLKSQTASLIGQAVSLLSAKLAVRHDVLSFEGDPPPVINCSNGELWINTDGTVDLRPHSPDSHLRHHLDVAYDPAATCPEYDKAAREIFSKSSNPRAMVRHWHELAGYIIYGRRNIPLIVLLVGGGSNGKTVLTETIIRLLGKSLVCAQPIGNFDSNRFAMGSLFGKFMLYDDDVKAGIRLPDGFLKTVSEAKTVTGEEKYKSPFNFTVRTVPMLLCNNVPSVADLSHGMQRRLHVIPFDRQFSEKEKDVHLFGRIWQNEMPGVLNRVVRGLGRLMKRDGALMSPKDVRKATAKFISESNPLPAFIKDRCEKGPDHYCHVQELYDAYKSWADSEGLNLKQQKGNVKRNLLNLGYDIKHANRGDKVVGLGLK